MDTNLFLIVLKQVQVSQFVVGDGHNTLDTRALLIFVKGTKALVHYLQVTSGTS